MDKKRTSKKIKLDTGFVVMEVNGRDITIKVGLGFETIRNIAKELVGVEDNLERELIIIRQILEFNTDIEEKQIQKDLELIVLSGLWRKIKENIINYDMLERAITKKTAIETLIGRFNDILNDFSPEDLTSLASLINEDGGVNAIK